MKNVSTVFKQLVSELNSFLGKPRHCDFFPLLLKQRVSLPLSAAWPQPLSLLRQDAGSRAQCTAGRGLCRPWDGRHLFFRSWREKVVMSASPSASSADTKGPLRRHSVLGEPFEATAPPPPKGGIQSSSELEQVVQSPCLPEWPGLPPHIACLLLAVTDATWGPELGTGDQPGVLASWARGSGSELFLRWLMAECLSHACPHSPTRQECF